MAYFSSCVIGYLFGSLNFANLLGKLKKTDVRELGTKNAGATNVAYIFGTHVGLIVAFFDILKAILAITITRIIFPQNLYADLITGTGCVLGHIFPVFMQFKGGKGLASFLGMTLALNWKFALIMLVMVAVVMLVTDYLVLGTVSAAVIVPLYSGIAEQSLSLALILCIASVVILIKHRDNYTRILSGTEIGLRRTLTKKDRVSKK